MTTTARGSMAIAEPSVVYPEAQFQSAVRSIVEDVLCGQQFTVLPKFGLDLAVFYGAGSSTVRFFEIKSYCGQRMGGVGFGNQHGAGQQVDMLLCEEACLRQFDRFVRWAYADATQPKGSSRYALFTCDLARRAAMGGVSRGKHNNLKISALRPNLVGWSEFTDLVRHFLEF